MALRNLGQKRSGPSSACSHGVIVYFSELGIRSAVRSREDA